MTGGGLGDLTRISYVAAQAFSGDYEVKVRRLWGQPLGGKARLEIVQHQGTPKETRRIETVKVDEPVVTLKVKLEDGRRTALATVPPPSALRREAQDNPVKTRRVMEKLRDVADPY